VLQQLATSGAKEGMLKEGGSQIVLWGNNWVAAASNEFRVSKSKNHSPVEGSDFRNSLLVTRY